LRGKKIATPEEPDNLYVDFIEGVKLLGSSGVQDFKLKP